MAKRTFGLATLFAVVALMVPAADAAKRYTVDATVKAAIVQGTPTTKNTAAGLVSGRPGGRGAVILRSTAPAGNKFTSRSTTFYPNGSVRGRSTTGASRSPEVGG
jgi:hypothetical protein